jgi:hypothetical protein
MVEKTDEEVSGPAYDHSGGSKEVLQGNGGVILVIQKTLLALTTSDSNGYTLVFSIQLVPSRIRYVI